MGRIHLQKEPRLDTKHQLFSYQLEAVEAIRDLDYGAVFHEQGLGKTKIAIDVALYWLENRVVDTVLFVVKKGLIRNWQREFAMHAFVQPRVLSQDRVANFYVFNSPSRVVLTHYEVLRGEEERFKLFLKTRDVGVILDESTKIKNPNAALTRSFFALSPLFKRRLIMTGTPVANRPHDLWAQIWFLDHGEALGDDFGEFKSQLDLSGELAEDGEARSRFEDELDTLFGRISSFSVRETKQNGPIALPDKVLHTATAEWEHYQYDLYVQIRDNLHAAVIREGIPTEDRSDDVLKRLLRLVQIASNPRLVDESYSAVPGKLPLLHELVERIADHNEKCIVWTSFTANADWLATQLKAHGALRLHGKMPMDRRDRAVERFMDGPACRVLVATPGAAKEGLTLTAANHVIFYDRTFSLDDYLQAQDRIHRISQAKTCHVTSLLMEDSIDQWVDALLHAKRMAAALAQGDISLDYYRTQVSYEFADILREILNIPAEGGGTNVT